MIVRSNRCVMRPTRVPFVFSIGMYLVIAAANFCETAQAEAPAGNKSDNPAVVRDLLWVWGNPEMAKPGPHTSATFAQAGPAERARLLGTPNIVMAGLGLPDDDQEAETLTRQVARAPRLIWEISPDGPGLGPPFVYRDTIALLRKLTDRYPQIEGVLLDDMSTQKIDRGFKPQHIRRIREMLSGKYAGVKVWGVLYTMSFDRKGINDYVKELEVINLWTWHAKDIVDLEKNVAHCQRLFPDKPIILGLYLYDYGGGRRMPMDLLKTQCETALELAHAGRIQGIVFLTINNDPEAVKWTADWIKRVGDQKLKPRPAQSRAGEQEFNAQLPGPSPWPTWIEGPNNTILMSFNQSGKVRIATSRDEGRNWKVFSTIEKKEGGVSGGYFTRLSENTLLFVTVDAGRKRVCWVRSDDNGRTWSEPTDIIALAPNLHAYGPICVMQDHRWAYCPYYQRGEEEFRALVMWSKDEGRTWGKPIAFPTPSDGNRGLTECTVVQLGANSYLAAIRADEGKTTSDGFYLSRSEDGVRWSVPESMHERGRMPLFYRLGGYWALAYRQYDFPKRTQHSVVRFSQDGQEWLPPRIIESGVNAGPQLVPVAGKILAFNTLYPASNVLTRHVVAVPGPSGPSANANTGDK